MIRYPVLRTVLEQEVDKAVPGWRTAAAAKTQAFVAAHEFNELEKDHSWSAVKSVFSARQNNKCIYCERLLASPKYGAVEHDLEHYRAKKRVLVWPPKAAKKRSAPYGFATGDASLKGYYWLAYELGNYAVACKSCNSGLKRDYFPIAGTRATAPAATVADLNTAEQPFLLFPFGNDGDDPDAFFGFEGIVPQPKQTAAAVADHAYRRALVTIHFFRLADPAREELFRERFWAIDRLWSQLELRETTPHAPKKAAAEREIQSMLEETQPHVACIRAFKALFDADPLKAFEIHETASAYLKSMGKGETP